MNGIGRNGNADVSGRPYVFGPSILSLLSLLIFSLCLASVSCTSKPTDMRTLVPADSLVYLETNDLGAALQPIVDSKPFTEAAKSKPDLSALKGVQLAVAVTGFETSEEKLTDEHSVGRIQPHFVAVADTHAWQFQAVGFAEQKLGSFVAEMYDGEPKLERSEKRDGRFFTWTAADGRKAFALVKGSLIYFGNDETAIDKCLAVKFDGADSIAKAGKVAASAPETLASGYIGPDGIAQIASLIGLKFASEAGEESEVQSSLAYIVPQLIRKSVTDVSWRMTKTEQGIEDKYQIGMPPAIANVFAETMAPAGTLDNSLFKWIPADAQTATLYNFRSPQTAWRSLILVAQNGLDPLGQKFVGELSHLIFQPYGIGDGDKFFSAGNSCIATANFSQEGDKAIVVSTSTEPGKIGDSLLTDLKTSSGRVNYDSVNSSDDGELAAFFDDDYYIGGDAETVDRIYQHRPNGPESGLLGKIDHQFGGNAAVSI